MLRRLKTLLRSVIATPGVKIAMANIDVHEIGDAELQKVAAALTIQCQQHFALPPPYGYGVSAAVRAVSKPADAHADEWLLVLLAKPDVAGAYGYHDETPAGLPVLKIFPKLDMAEGSPWSVTASHEVLEALADPNLARAAMDRAGRFWAYEVCDGVEGDKYQEGDVWLSNFALPPYFEPTKAAAKLDWMGLCKKPMELRPGGYNQWFDPRKGWQQVENFEQAPRPYRKAVQGRGVRRRQCALAPRSE